MKRRIFTCLLSIILALASPALHAQSATSSWEPVATGIDYQKFQLDDPNNVFVARMTRDNPNVIIDSSIARGKLSGGFETVSGMAERYDQAINYWDQSWGSRNDVVVAINGFFYNIETGIPRSGQILSGWYAKRFDNYSGESGFAWRLDRTVFIGRCVTHAENKQTVSIPAAGKRVYINGINVERNSNQLILYTPQYDNNTQTDDSGMEILVEMTRPTLILPSPNYAIGYVREIRNNQGSTPIPFDHVVLSAHGTKVTSLANVDVGDEIRISQEITHYKKDCNTLYARDWTKTYASIGGSFIFLEGGTINEFDDLGALERHPRTAIAYNDTYIFFIVVDGRDPDNSIGMTIEELAYFTRDTLGATWGIAQDGGGSSTMVVNGVVVNRPNADELEYEVYFPMVITRGQGATQGSSTDVSPAAETSALLEPLGGIERYVANGMLMIVVEPKEQSAAFSPDDLILTKTSTDVRLGPGTNYGILTTVPENTIGVVLNHMNGLNGILAKDSYWWKISIAGVDGWVAEQFLEQVGS